MLLFYNGWSDFCHMRSLILFIISIFTGNAMTAEPAKAIVLQSSDQEHFGFTLFHPDFGASEGDCVFVIVPKDADLYASKEVSILLDIKESGEHQWVRSGDDVVVSFNGSQTLKYLGNGTLVHLPSDTVLGGWFPTSAKQ
jgi:hypothetical protein